MADADNATIVAWTPNHAELVSAFHNWSGTDSDLRVFFTPDVLIGFDSATRRGYLFDDGWTVEVWIERGLPELLDLLLSQYLDEHCDIERPLGDPPPQQVLLELALSRGAPIDEVRHLIQQASRNVPINGVAACAHDRHYRAAMAERAVLRDRPFLRWSPGAPAPILIATEWRTLVAFYLAGPAVRNDMEVQVAEFASCTAVRFGFPNDEVLHGHPLWGHGLEFYSTHEVEDSLQLRDLLSIERVHPRAADNPFHDQKHFILTFHDSTLEAIAAEITDTGQYRTISDAIAAMSVVARNAQR